MSEHHDTDHAGEYALVATGLRKTYVTKRNFFGRPSERLEAVAGIDIRVARGTTLAVVGESGAGKSTVGRLVLRLIESDAGNVELLGSDLMAMSRGDLRRMRRRATMIFQDPYTSLNPRMLIETAVAEPLIAAGVGSSSVREKRVREALDAVGMAAHHAQRFPYELSGGQLQRIAIARALITDPDFIVCDEPVAALDMSTQAQVINLLRDLQQERGLAYLFISHDLSLVQVLADEVAIMRHGRLVESGPAQQIFTNPSDDYTRTLIDAVPRADPRERRFRPAPASSSQSSTTTTRDDMGVGATP